MLINNSNSLCINYPFKCFFLIFRVYHPKSGIFMKVTSTQPGVQLYTANFLPEDNSLHGKEKACYKKNGGFCLETQNYPNAINQVTTIVNL